MCEQSEMYGVWLTPNLEFLKAPRTRIVPFSISWIRWPVHCVHGQIFRGNMKKCDTYTHKNTCDTIIDLQNLIEIEFSFGPLLLG